MRKVYNATSILRVLFTIFILVWQVQKYYRNHKTTRFQKLIIWMIQILTILQIVYGFKWSFSIFANCMFWERNISAFIEIDMFLIGVLVTYYMYVAVNMIYKFSVLGRLPNENHRKRFKNIVIGVVIFTIICFASYVGFSYYIAEINSDFDEIHTFEHVYSGIRAAGYMTNAGLLVMTIFKLSSAKVTGSDTGHLNLRDAILLLILLLVMTGLGLCSAYVRDWNALIYVNTAKDSVDYLIAIMYFKMITKFITTFKLQT